MGGVNIYIDIQIYITVIYKISLTVSAFGEKKLVEPTNNSHKCILNPLAATPELFHLFVADAPTALSFNFQAPNLLYYL